MYQRREDPEETRTLEALKKRTSEAALESEDHSPEILAEIPTEEPTE